MADRPQFRTRRPLTRPTGPIDGRYLTHIRPTANPMSPGRNGLSSIQGVNNILDSQMNSSLNRRIDATAAQTAARGSSGFVTQMPSGRVPMGQGTVSQGTVSPYERYGESLPPAGFSMGTVSPDAQVEFLRRVGGSVNNILDSQMDSSLNRRINATAAQTAARGGSGFVTQMPSGRVPMSPLASNAQPQGNPFMDEQEAAVADQGLIDRLEAQVRQMQAANPKVPGSPGISPYAAQDEAMRQQEVQGRRTGQFLDDNPMAGSSTDANRIARSIPTDIYNRQTAGASNGYEGNIAYANDPDRYNPMDPRTQAIQQRNAASQTAGRPVGGDDRFTGNNPLAQRAAQQGLDEQREARGEGVFIQPGGRGQPLQFIPNRRSPEEAYQNAMAQERPEAKLAKYNEREARIRELQANRRSSMPPGEYDKLRAKQVDFAAKKAAEHEAFKAANGGKNYAQARRENTRAKHQDGRFKRDVRRGMNPMSPGAFAAHPEAGARFRNAYAQAGKGADKVQNPMTVPFQPGAPDTPENRQARGDARKQFSETSPTLAAHGLTADSSPADVADSFAFAPGDISDAGLQEYHGFIKSLEPGINGASPFADMQATSPETFAMLEEARNFPADTKPEVLRAWHNKYKEAAARQRAKAQGEYKVQPSGMEGVGP